MPENETRLRVKVEPFFKWFDIWFGVYIDREHKAIYICPIPTLGIKIQWWYETRRDADVMNGWKQATDYMTTLIQMGKTPEEALQQTKEIAAKS